MKKILTCIDGSIYSRSVCELAAWAARQMDAAVHVIHMLDAHRERAQAYDWTGNIGIDTKEALLQQLVDLEEAQGRLARERGELLLKEAAAHLTGLGVGEVTVEQQHGALVEAVVELEAGADLVVIGKRGESANFAKGHLGSNLERVVRASIRPVLVAARKFEPIEKFLIAYDDGPSVQKAIDFMGETPLLKGAQATLLHAGKETSRAVPSLRDAAEKLKAAGYEVDVQIADGEPEEVIADAVKQGSIGLLVMGAYGHSRVRNLMIGSTTTSVVRTCQIPILMFR